MATLTHEIQLPLSVPAAKLFKALVLEGDNYIPKITGQGIKNVGVLGSGGAGTVKNYVFADGGEKKSVKKKIDGIDQNNLTCTFTFTEGEPWIDGLDKLCIESQCVPSGGGSICKNVYKYYAKGGDKLNEGQVKAFEEKLSGQIKDAEAYLLANPNV